MRVRILLIQELFNLSDEQVEFQLQDRLSFQRFSGLRHSSQIPDHVTIGNFRALLSTDENTESMLDAVNRQMAKHGYLVRSGQMIEASIVQAANAAIANSIYS